jgi:hypothetical protein
MIAVGCKGSAPGGTCNFDELIRYLQNPNAPFKLSSGVGNELKPDVAATVKALAQLQSSFDFDQTKLAGPGVLSPNPKLKVTFEKVLAFVLPRMDAVLSKSTEADAKQLHDALKLSMQGVHEYRIADQAPHLIPILNARIQELGSVEPKYEVELKNPKPTTMDGFAYDEVDVAETDNKHPGFKAIYNKYIPIVMKQKLNHKVFGPYIRHAAAAVACQKAETTLHDIQLPTGGAAAGCT